MIKKKNESNILNKKAENIIDKNNEFPEKTNTINKFSTQITYNNNVNYETLQNN